MARLLIANKRLCAEVRANPSSRRIGCATSLRAGGTGAPHRLAEGRLPFVGARSAMSVGASPGRLGPGEAYLAGRGL